MSLTMQNKEYHCRTLQPEDAGQVRQLFQQVFRQEMSPELWSWKYGNEQGRATVVFDGDELVAHYGGMGRKVLWQGQETQAVQITDVMVAVGSRHSVRSQSPFYLAFTGFAQHYLGYGKDFPLAYGFPNHRVMKLAELLGFYAPVGDMMELTWPATTSLVARLVRTARVTSENFALLQDKLDAAWQAMARTLTNSIVGVKDAAWLHQRYLSHPARQYEVLLVQPFYSTTPLGVLVLRHDADKTFLMDVIADVKKIPAMVRVAASLAEQQGKHSLYTWCAGGKTRHFETAGYSKTALPIVIPANIWTEGPKPDELRGRWWLMPGDTDFQ